MNDNPLQPVWRPQSQAGHYVVAAAIILAAVLLILFLPRNNCCCCCQRIQATASTTTLGQLPITIQPGEKAPLRPVARRASVAPAIVLPSVSASSQTYGEVFQPEQAGTYYTGTDATYPDVGYPIPLPRIPYDCRKRHKTDKHCTPVVKVAEPGGSLAWVAVGVAGLALMCGRSRPLG